MLFLYDALRVLSRAFAAGVISTLFTGKAEPFGVKFEEGQATLLAAGLAILSFLAFIAESWAKKKAGA